MKNGLKCEDNIKVDLKKVMNLENVIFERIGPLFAYGISWFQTSVQVSTALTGVRWLS
jgi:hypothetical protein